MSDAICPRCGGPASRPIHETYCARCDADAPTTSEMIATEMKTTEPETAIAAPCSVSSTGQHKFVMLGLGSVCVFCGCRRAGEP
jgi:hypothetical protein